MPIYEFEGKRPLLPADDSAWVAPTACLIGDVHLGQGASVWFGAVIRGDNTAITVGAYSNVQEQSVLHSDEGIPCAVGRWVTVGHKVVLHGCHIGDNVLIGMGATILNKAVIPENCLVGAGALVTEGQTFEPGTLIVGAPAKAVRKLDCATIEGIRKLSMLYVDKAQGFRQDLKEIAT